MQDLGEAPRSAIKNNNTHKKKQYLSLVATIHITKKQKVTW